MYSYISTAKVAALAAIISAATASGDIGSIISSFPASFTLAHSVFRDTSYVYTVSTPYHGYSVGFLKYTPGGELAGGYTLYPEVNRVPEDADVSFLGGNYISIAMESGVWTYDAGGFLVRQDHMELIESIGYAYRPGGPYYYVEVGNYTDASYAIYRFDTSGSLLGSFIPAYPGSLAATDRFAGLSGEYLIAAAGVSSAVYNPSGSVLATFPINIGWHMGCGVGPGYPASLGPTLWIGNHVGGGSGWIYQIDLGNGETAGVHPASLGRVKTVFR